MTDMDHKKAVIYCRVSDPKQRIEGNGLESQEHRCRQYAAQHGYEVDAVFPDDISGGGDFMKRPGMVAMLHYLAARPDTPYVVIFDDLKRFARDTFFHLKLRHELSAVGASIECLNYRFDETPEGQFVETIFAAQGQLEREQNRRQVIQKMTARVERGFWVFSAPVGYQYKKSQHGKVLVRDEPIATILQEALENYADGRFQTPAEVKRYLEGFPEFPRGRNGEVHYQRINDYLTRPVYAGHVEAPNWGVSLRPGQHEGLISFETFQKIQRRLKEGAKAPVKKNLSEDFPLRGFITCGDCGSPLTSCWSKGRGKHYPYYLCCQKGCASYGKSIKRETLEGEFRALLLSLKPTEALFRTAEKMMRALWEHRSLAQKDRRKALESQQSQTEKKIEQLLDRIVDAESPTVIAAYEKRIQKLEADKLELQEKAANSGRPLKSFEDSVRTALGFLATPCNLWDSDRLEDKRTVLKLAFADKLSYVRNEGFRTAKTTLPFKALGGFCGVEMKLVGPLGLEPRTKGL